jgi:hypothetical protein
VAARYAAARQVAAAAAKPSVLAACAAVRAAACWAGLWTAPPRKLGGGEKEEGRERPERREEGEAGEERRDEALPKEAERRMGGADTEMLLPSRRAALSHASWKRSVSTPPSSSPPRPEGERPEERPEKLPKEEERRKGGAPGERPGESEATLQELARLSR